MKLTAPCMYFVFSSLFWTTVGSGQGYPSEDKGSGPCAATLQLEEPCGHGQEDAACLYSLSLPALTVHLPSQLRDLEKIMRELQDLKDTVDQLRKKCADCTVRQTEKMCDMHTEKEHVKLNENTEKREDEWRCVNKRSKEKSGDDFGSGKIKGTEALGGVGEINTENRTDLDRGGRNKLQAVKESNQGLIKEMEGAEVSPEVSEKDGKSRDEGVTVSGNLAWSTTLTANGKTEVTHGETVAEKNNSEQKGMEGNKNEKLTGDKGKITQKEGEKNSSDINMDNTASYQEQMDGKKQTEENQVSERIMTSEDYAGHINKEQEQQGVDSKENTGEEIKAWQNNKILKPTENNGLVVKGKTINSGESGETDGVTSAEIKTQSGNVVQGGQRPSDEKLTSNDAEERKDFVSVSQTPPSITGFITGRHKTMDPNKVITLTSPLSSTSLWSSPHLITDVNEATVIAALGLPSQSTDFEHTQIYEQPHPDADASFRTTNDPTATPTLSTLEVPRQQITTITNRFTSTSSPRSWPGVQGQVHSTSATKIASTHVQHFFTTTMAAVTERSSRGAKNTSPSMNTGRKFGFGQGVNLGKKQGMKPEATQKLKNSKNDHKHDRAPIPEKKTRPVQKLKPLVQKPTVDPNIKSRKPGASEQQTHTAKPDQRVSHHHLTTGENQQNNSLLGRDKGQELNSNQTSAPPDQRAPSPQRPSTVGTTGSTTVQTGINTHLFPPYGEKTTAQNIKNISLPQQGKRSPERPTSNQKPATVNQTGSHQDSESENYNNTSSDGRIISQNVYKNPLLKQHEGLPTNPNRSNVQKPHSHQKSKIPSLRPTSVNTTRSDKSQIIKTTSKPDLFSPLDKMTTVQNKHKQTRGQNPNFNRTFSPPAQRPPSHNRTATVNLKGSAKDPRREKYAKPDHSTPRLKITPNLKKNASRIHNQDLKPNIHQMPLPPVQRPRPHQKSAATNTNSSELGHVTAHHTTTPGYSIKINKITIDQNMNHDQYPVLDTELTSVQNMLEILKENSHQASVSYDSLVGPTSDQTVTTISPTDLDQDPATEVHSVTDQITLPSVQTTDQKFRNISLLMHDKGQRSNSQPQPEAPVQRTTFHQRTATVNTIGLVKVSGITTKSDPDHSTTVETTTAGKNMKNNPAHDKGQKTNSSSKSSPPAQRPATHKRPASGSVINPQRNQKTKSPLVPDSERAKNTKLTLSPSNRSSTFNRNNNEGPSPESEQYLDTTPLINLSLDGDKPSDQDSRPVQKDPLHYKKQELNSNKRTKADVKAKVSQIPRKHAETPDQKTLRNENPEPQSNRSSTPRPTPAHRSTLQPEATSVHITPKFDPDHSTTDEIITAGKNMKNNPAPAHDKSQKTNSSSKSSPSAQRPATHKRPASGSVINPQRNQKTKSPLVPDSKRAKNTKLTLSPSNRSSMFNRNNNEGPSPESEQYLDTTPLINLSLDGNKPSDQDSRPVQKDPLHYKKQELNSNKRTKADVKAKVSQIPRKHAETPDQKTLPDETIRSSTLPPTPAHRPTLQPEATSVQRPEPAVRLESSPNNKTDSNPYLSGITPDGTRISQIDLLPTSGPLSRDNKITHSTGLLTESPDSRTPCDLKPQTVREPSLIPVTTRPNIMIRGILPSVITSTSPGATKFNSNTKPSAASLMLHSTENTAPGKTSGSEKPVFPVTYPGAHTSSILSPDTESTTSVTSGPQLAAAEYSTPSARELRVKINQVAAFPSDRQGSTGPIADLFPKQHPADNNKGDGADYRKWMASKEASAIRDCSDHLLRGKTKSGVYTVTPDLRSKSFPVFCDMDLTGGGWTLLQLRQDGSVSFNRTWADYRSGFGQLNGGEFWLGNNLIHLLTRDRDMVLRVELEDFDGLMEYAEYDKFKVASERLRYRLTIGVYSGTAGDALRFNKMFDHNNKPFTTPDRDNDRYPSGNCGAYYSSGWWFDACMSANLNGRYYKEGRYKGLRDGIFWGTWHNITSEYYPTNYRHSFKTVRMMIRPKRFDP
uniref:Uncharacterized LOC103380191 n=1 Tax=Cynoglossus semilaevis TaxID=244447 RepID=A0A3P8V2D7_CYNSE